MQLSIRAEKTYYRIFKKKPFLKSSKMNHTSNNQENMFSRIFIGVVIAVISAVIIYAIGIDEGSAGVKKNHVLSGQYEGVCYNKTYGQAGRLVLNFLPRQDGTIGGSVNITGDLYGSGDLEGYFDKKNISFTSKEASTGLIITWKGKLSGNTISGKYVASVPPYLKMQTGWVDQEGEWKVMK